jgi:hypothetical protein
MSAHAAIRSSRWLGTFPHTRTELWVLVGQDGGQSVDLGPSTLFLFSDTLLAPLQAVPGRAGSPPPFRFQADGPCHFLANSAGVASGPDLRGALASLRYLCHDDGFPRELLEPTLEERGARLRFWPQHGVYLDEQVYLWYLGIQATGETMWEFRNRGVGLAVLDPGSGDCRRLRRGGDWRLWHPTSDDLHFGVQALELGGHLYVFGSRRRDQRVGALLGRVPPEAIADPAAYRYLQPATGRWVSDLREAGSLGVCGADYSVSFNAYLGNYLMTFVDSFTKQLFIRLADDICGPYSPPRLVGRLPHRPSSELIYIGFEHPKYAADGGRRVYVSYCQPSFTPNSLLELCFDKEAGTWA